MAYPDSVTNAATIAPGGSLTASGVTAGMTKYGHDQNLRLQMTLDDVFATFSSDTIKDPDGMDIPNAIFLKLGGDAKRGTQSMTIGMTTPYSGGMQIGDVYVPGTEVKDDLMYATFYYGEYGYAVGRDNFGRTANEMDFYSVYEKQTPKIAHYLSEQKGKRIREAIVETYDHVIVEDSKSGVSAHVLNSNWFIFGADSTYAYKPDAAQAAIVGATDGFGQPVATQDLATVGVDGTWVDLITDVMLDAGSTPADANITLDGLRSLAYYAKMEKHIEPLDNGKYIMVIPKSQEHVFLALTADGGTIIKANKRSEGDDISYTYKLTEVDNLEIYVDDRFPSLEITPGAADVANSAAVVYLEPGNVDDRVSAVSANNWHLGYLLGKAAVAEWEVTPVHWETELGNYKKREGNGAFGENGYGLVEFDNDDGYTDVVTGVRTNIGSIVVGFTAPALF